MADALMVGELYCDDDWPHGLACGQCRHVFRESERYIAQLDGFIEDTLLRKIVCLACFGLDEPR
jgi:hypothetical protein